MAFYTFNQNNSGGSFAFDADDGITHFVIIEADSAIAANRKATQIGLYFNGCDTGSDCSCCGDRWYPVDEWDARDEPLLYGAAPSEYYSNPWGLAWMAPNPETFIHYADGRVEAA